jgi:hypothetical protein
MTGIRFAVAAAMLAAPAALCAQSLQRVSIQGSGALVFPTQEQSGFDNGTRLGYSAQLRYTFSRFSLGAGYQRSTVYKIQGEPFSGAVSLGFLEPRYVAAAGSGAALYLAGRLGLGSLVCSPATDCPAQDLEVVLGGGAGVLVALGSRFALDLGAQYFSTRITRQQPAGKARTGFVLARAGLSVGL